MRVSDVIAIAREWVETHGSQQPGFRGAHLMGGLATLPASAEFPPYRDVDIAVITEVGAGQMPLEQTYRGLMIECGRYAPVRYRDAATLLVDPELAPHVAAGRILADPSGMLHTLHTEVAERYASPECVLARCSAAKHQALGLLAQLERVEAFDDYLQTLVILVIQPLCGLLAIAARRVPTHRRSLALAGELLDAAGRPELHEALLDLLGFAARSRIEVEGYLAPVAAAYERAVALKRTPTPFDYKLHAHLRPYFIEGARELIQEGRHREAMWWLLFAATIGGATIQQDGSAAEWEEHQALLGRLLAVLPTEAMSARRLRVLRARRLADQIFALADVLAHNYAEAQS